MTFPLKNDQPDEIKIIYDGECPLCQNYVRMMRLRAHVKHVVLIDARQTPDAVNAMTAHGFDINNGMLVIYGDTPYYGADGMHILALLSSSNTLFNRMIGMFFRSKRMSSIFYPICRSGRGLLLKILGRQKITTSHY